MVLPVSVLPTNTDSYKAFDPMLGDKNGATNSPIESFDASNAIFIMLASFLLPLAYAFIAALNGFCK